MGFVKKKKINHVAETVLFRCMEQIFSSMHKFVQQIYQAMFSCIFKKSCSHNAFAFLTAPFQFLSSFLPIDFKGEKLLHKKKQKKKNLIFINCLKKQNKKEKPQEKHHVQQTVLPQVFLCRDGASSCCITTVWILTV